MRTDLALDALEGIVDGLAVAAQALADVGVGVPVEVEREHARFKLREDGRQAGDERAQLLEEITWLTGSWTVEPGSISSRLGSESEEPAGVAENDT